LDLDESSLTGETEPVRKNIEDIVSKNVPISDRKNMVFMGTLVRNGYGTAIVVGTGNHTELGLICSMMKDVPLPHSD
jgi:P-type Ca2+ transporter type 2C